MSDISRRSLRNEARFFAVIFQVLAFLTLAGTLIAIFKINNVGTQVDVNGSWPDPGVWIIVAVGLFASCVLTGLGYALGMLCAIFDRQK